MGCDSIGIVIEKGSVVPMGIDLGERRGVFMHGKSAHLFPLIPPP